MCKLLGFEVYDKKVKNLAYGGYSSADHFGWLKRWLKPIVLARGQSNGRAIRKISLEGAHGKFLLAEGNGAANANRPFARTKESFQTVPQGKNKFAKHTQFEQNRYINNKRKVPRRKALSGLQGPAARTTHEVTCF